MSTTLWTSIAPQAHHAYPQREMKGKEAATVEHGLCHIPVLGERWQWFAKALRVWGRPRQAWRSTSSKGIPRHHRRMPQIHPSLRTQVYALSTAVRTLPEPSLYRLLRVAPFGLKIKHGNATRVSWRWRPRGRTSVVILDYQR